MASTPALDFAVIYVSDLQASLAYFTERLGFTQVPEQSTPFFHYLTGGAGGKDFGILQATESTPRPGAVELYFKTADLEGLRAILTGRDVEATPIAHQPFGSIFTVQSPDRHLLTMMQPLAEG
jgi:catechol 2,3-dioxygenase-like lactoylglutathione lyase family enzyme